MDETKRSTIRGWLEKASHQLIDAKEHLKSYCRYSDCIQAAQVSLELSVKSILNVLEVDYSLSHGWDRKQMSEIAEQIRDRDLLKKLKAEHLEYSIPLARLLFRANFWSQFYLVAKYGLEAGHLAPAQDLFEKEDAELAVRHADAAQRAAWNLFNLAEEKRLGLL